MSNQLEYDKGDRDLNRDCTTATSIIFLFFHIFQGQLAFQLEMEIKKVKKIDRFVNTRITTKKQCLELCL